MNRRSIRTATFLQNGEHRGLIACTSLQRGLDRLMMEMFSSAFVVLSLVTLAHSRPANDIHWPKIECDCTSNNDQSNITVMFERLESRKSKKKDDILWFRLRNQTRCPIFLPTDHAYGLITMQGRTIVGLENGSVVFVKYEVKRISTQKGGRSAFWISYLRGTTYNTRLGDGDSGLFYIPKSNLKRGSHLAIPYVCEATASFNSSSPRVLFDLRTLPTEVLGRFSTRA